MHLNIRAYIPVYRYIPRTPLRNYMAGAVNHQKKKAAGSLQPITIAIATAPRRACVWFTVFRRWRTWPVSYTKRMRMAHFLGPQSSKIYPLHNSNRTCGFHFKQC